LFLILVDSAISRLCLRAANDVGMWSSYKALHQAEFLRHIKITKEKAVSYYMAICVVDLCLPVYSGCLLSVQYGDVNVTKS